MPSLLDANSRYHRQELITWWDQSKIRNACVLVVGAGALGNEVCKNLALVGVGSITIVDMDVIEHSNLARCVFFREEHEGSNKAEILAMEIGSLNSEVSATSIPMPVQRMGIGSLRSFDLIIGALDNREARAWVNQASRKLGLYWIDGAIEGLRGLVRMFGPSGACYSCTLTEDDYRQMSFRKSCALLAPNEILAGKTPTNATTASVVAGVQVQEAIKFLVGNLEALSLVGKCWVFTGDTMDSYVTRYAEDEYCLAHDYYESVVDLPSARTLQDLIDQSGPENGAWEAAIDFEEDVISLLPCKTCGGDFEIKVRSAFKLGEGQCAGCGNERIGEMYTSVLQSEVDTNRTFVEFGLGKSEIITIRSGEARQHFVVSGEHHG